MLNVRRLYSLIIVAFLGGCVTQQTPHPLPPGSRDAVGVNPLIDFTPKRDDQMRIHVLNVGAGTCQLVECPGNGNPLPLLVDCGSSQLTVSDLNSQEAAQYIQEIVDDTVTPIVVISHPDKDHWSHIPTIFPNDEYDIQSIWLGGRWSDYDRTIQRWIENEEINGTPVYVGFNANYSGGGRAVADLACGDASTFILTVNSGSTRNDMSMVLGIDYGSFKAIFPGDATDVTQDAAIRNFTRALDSTVLIGSHHGSDTHGSNDQGWADATRPDITVFSAGTKYAHPRCGSMEVYRPYLIRANPHPIVCGDGRFYGPKETSLRAEYVTEDNGAIVITGNSDNTFFLTCSRSRACGF